MSDHTITSDHPLTESQRQDLNGLLNLIIPPGEDGRMPGAGEIGLLEPGTASDELLQAAAAILPGLAELAESLGPLEELSAGKEQSALMQLAGSHMAQFQQFVMQTLILYYRHDRVMEGLGLEPGPPFPRGNTIEPGDLSLLDPVKSRPPMYRSD